MAIDNPLDAYEAQHLKDEPMLPNKLARYATDFGIKLALPGGGLAVEILIGVLDKLCDRESGIERVKEGSFDYAQDDNSRNPYRSHPFAKNAKWWGSLGGGNIVSHPFAKNAKWWGSLGGGNIVSHPFAKNAKWWGSLGGGNIVSHPFAKNAKWWGSLGGGNIVSHPFAKNAKWWGCLGGYGFGCSKAGDQPSRWSHRECYCKKMEMLFPVASVTARSSLPLPLKSP